MNLLQRYHVFRFDKRDFWIAFLALVATISFIPVFTYFYFAQDLTSTEGIMNRNDTGFTLLDRNGTHFFTFYQAKQKEFIPLSEVPDETQKALIAMEDKDFYSHPGFSIRGIARSVFLNLTNNDITYGGSTITQQLVKNALLNPQKSFLRKYQEIVLSQEIERRYSKNEILEMYFNSVYFGEGAFGIQEASERYFDKNAKDLTLSESALLIGILPSPSRLSLLSGDLNEAKKRQRLVLDAMLEEDYITSEQKDKALKEETTLSTQENDLNSVAPHFALLVKQQLIDRFGEERVSRSGFTVKTTIDLEKQKYAEEVVARQVAALARNRVSNGAAVVLNPKSGEILSYVGSKNWFEEEYGKFDVATAKRQPGSAFKPIIYTAAFEKNIITPATVLKDQPITYRPQFSPEYKPENYDKRFRGNVTVRRALANSLNVPAVEVLYKLGIQNAVDFSKKIGISTLNSPDNYGLSLVLGAAEVKLLDMVSAYGVFANGGIKNNPITILEIEDKTKKTIFRYTPDPQKILDENYSFLISSILSDNNARAEVFGNALTISRVAAVKTGTTENYKDAWTIGYTPSVVVGVWVGNNDGKPMDNIAGSLGAAPIWRQLMERFLQGTSVETFSPPSGVTFQTVCILSGTNATQSATIREYFITGTQPAKPCIVTPTVNPTSNLPTPTGSSQPPTPTTAPPNNGNGEKKDKDKKQTVIPSVPLLP